MENLFREKEKISLAIGMRWNQQAYKSVPVTFMKIFKGVTKQLLINNNKNIN